MAGSRAQADHSEAASRVPEADINRAAFLVRTGWKADPSSDLRSAVITAELGERAWACF
jgi:hypothetical protein